MNKLICLFLVSVAVIACGNPVFPTTGRPKVDVSPWTEKSVQGKSGHTFDYLYLEGPSPDAPAIVMLHGGIFDHRMWIYMNELSKHASLYALEFPDTHEFYNGRIDGTGKVVADFMATINADEIYIASVSAGAWAAIDYLSKTKDPRVKGLVLASTVMWSISEEEIKKRTRMSSFALGLSPGKMQGVVDSRARKTDYAEAPGKLQQIDIFYTRPYPYYYQIFSQSWNQGEKPQDTQSITCPVLVLHGDKDDIMPIDAARMTPSVFSNASFKEIKDAGHDMVFSHGPQLAKIVAEFFKLGTR